jgi:hypothetical protein
VRDEEPRALVWGGSPPVDEVTPPLYYRVDATTTPDGLKIFVLQERVVPTRGIFRLCSDEPRELEMFYDRNAYVFGGRFAGYTTRVSRSPITNMFLGGGIAPILLEA